jgi:endonuclease/exonuclease/phosphatase family metal-dependent hydrolase
MIKVMTFNIRIALADDGENNWENRKSLAADRIRAFAPDLLGLQECYDGEQAAYVKQALPEYSFFGVRRGGQGDTALEMAPLLYRNETFLLIRQGVFWLSETPDLPGSKSWDSVFPRTVA